MVLKTGGGMAGSGELREEVGGDESQLDGLHNGLIICFLNQRVKLHFLACGRGMIPVIRTKPCGKEGLVGNKIRTS